MIKKMVCSKGIFLHIDGEGERIPALIEGKIYDVDITFNSGPNSIRYEVVTEQGLELPLIPEKGVFMDIDKWRELQLNKIGIQ